MVGYVSRMAPAGLQERRTKVVELAPKLKKNWSSAKQTMNAGLLRVWNLPARIATAE